jgi:hypothetical protein
MSNVTHLTVTLSTATRMVADFGTTNTFILLSSPGVGKSSMLDTLAEKYPEHDAIYVDCPTFDQPDVGMAIPNQEEKKLEFFINETFKLSGKGAKRPKLIMLDELLKCRGTVGLAFTRLMLNHNLLGQDLPEGSVVFCTSNEVGDGVGDRLEGHKVNRVTILHILSEQDRWEDWALKNNINPMLIAWTRENAYVFGDGTATGDQGDAKVKECKQFVFNANAPGQSFASPRSIAKCSPFVDKLSEYDRNDMLALLAGTVGTPAALSMFGFFNLMAKVVSFDRIVADPAGVPVVSEGAVPIIQVLNAVARIKTVHDLEQFMTFLLRMERDEPKMLFIDKIQKIKPDLAPRSERVRNQILRMQNMI